MKFFDLISEVDWYKNLEIPMLYVSSDHFQDPYMILSIREQKNIIQKTTLGEHIEVVGAGHPELVGPTFGPKVSKAITSFVAKQKEHSRRRLDL